MIRLHGVMILAALSACPIWAQDEAKAMAVVDKAITAMGGADKLAKATAQTWKAKGKMSMNGMSTAYDIVYHFAQPDRFRFDLELEFDKQKVSIAAATDGKVAWESALGMTRDMDKKKAEDFINNVHGIYLSQLTPLKDKRVKLSYLGEEKSGEQTLIGIKASVEGKPDIKLYFDAKTLLLHKTSRTAYDEFSGKNVEQVATTSGYKDGKSGIKTFDKLTVTRDGKEFLVEELSDWTILDKVDEKKFAKP